MTNRLFRNRGLLLVPALALAALLLLLAACGGDDDDGGGSPTPSGDVNGSPAATGRETPVPSGEPINSPAGTAGPEAVCTEGESQRGLLSTLEFGGDDGLFEPGEDVEMTLTLINCDEVEEDLFYTTTQRYVFIIELVPEDSDVGAEVWRSSDGKVYAETAGELIMQPNETVVYTETWDQTDSVTGEQVEEGRYKISAFSVGCGSEDRSDCRFGPIKYIEVTSGDDSGDDES